MNSIKIIQRFYTLAEAKSAAQYQRQKAKKENILLAKVEVVSAYELFKTNNWFKKSPFKLGMPSVDQYMVIVHYAANAATPINNDSLKNRIVKATQNNNVVKKFFIVKINHFNLAAKSALNLNMVINLPILGWRFKYKTRFGKSRKSLSVPFPVHISYRIAA